MNIVVQVMNIAVQVMSYGPELENLPTSCWVVTKNFHPGEIILPQIVASPSYELWIMSYECPRAEPLFYMFYFHNLVGPFISEKSVR